MRTVIEDFKYAFRALVRRPGLIGMVTLTLAVAVSGSVVIFSVIDTVLHLLPIEQPDRVVFLESSNPQRGPTRLRVSLPDFQDWRAQNITFEQLGAFSLDTLNLTGTDKPLRVSVVRASASLFDVWGVRPALGRSFRSEEDRRGAEPMIMFVAPFLATLVWRRREMGRADASAERCVTHCDRRAASVDKLRRIFER